MCVLSIKVPIRKKSGNLFNDPHIYIYIYIYIVNNLSRRLKTVTYIPFWQLRKLVNGTGCHHKNR